MPAMTGIPRHSHRLVESMYGRSLRVDRGRDLFLREQRMWAVWLICRLENLLTF